MICPILSLATLSLTVADDEVWKYVDCRKEKCALWIGKEYKGEEYSHCGLINYEKP